MILVALALLVPAVLCTVGRLARGPSIPDRVVAVDATAAVVVGMMAVLAVALDEPVFLDVAIVIALIAFVGTVAFAQYLARPSDR
jgi:multicomponent Na+:H+ antiporter subunit F